MGVWILLCLIPYRPPSTTSTTNWLYARPTLLGGVPRSAFLKFAWAVQRRWEPPHWCPRPQYTRIARVSAEIFDRDPCCDKHIIFWDRVIPNRNQFLNHNPIDFIATFDSKLQQHRNIYTYKHISIYYTYMHTIRIIYPYMGPDLGWALGPGPWAAARDPGPQRPRAPCKDIWFLLYVYMYSVWIYVYVYVYHELIVLLYLGLVNTFWIVDFSELSKYPQTVNFVVFVDFLCVFDKSESQLESQIARTLQTRR